MSYEHDGREPFRMTKEEAIKRVQKGAALLDKFYPEGWRNAVNSGGLLMEDTRYCVLGQLYGSFGRGLALLGLDFNSVAEHGFALTDSEYADDGEVGYALLTAAWRKELSNAS